MGLVTYLDLVTINGVLMDYDGKSRSPNSGVPQRRSGAHVACNNPAYKPAITIHAPPRRV